MDDIANTMIAGMLSIGPKLGFALGVFAAFWILAKIAGTAITKLCNKAQLDKHVSVLLTKLGKISLLVFGAITALGTAGVNVSALVAGLGLTGFALGFALKDTISNMLAGVLILIYRPFQVADHIQVAGHEGKVVSIDLRYTTLECDAKKVLIPNSSLFTSPISLLKKE